MKTLSIIIVNFNSTKLLIDLLHTLTNGQSLPYDWELIIIDNASNIPISKKDIIRYVPNVKLVFNKTNIGYAAANNIGIHRANGKYVLLLNPDTLVTKSTIKELLEYIKSKKNIGAVTCRIELPNGELDDACHRGFPTPINAIFYFSKLALIFPYSSFINSYHLGYKDLGIIHEIDAGTGAFLLIDKKAGDVVDWFDETFFWYGDDLDLCFRLKKLGYKIMFYPYCKITHLKGMSSGIKDHTAQYSTASFDIRKKAQIARFKSMRLFFYKYYEKKYPWLVLKLIYSGISALELFYRIKTKTL